MSERRRVRIEDITADPDYRQNASDIRVRRGKPPKGAVRAQFAAPLLVNERDGRLFIIDGWFRLGMMAEAGIAEVEVEVEHLTREEEVERWIAMNSTWPRP